MATACNTVQLDQIWDLLWDIDDLIANVRAYQKRGRVDYLNACRHCECLQRMRKDAAVITSPDKITEYKNRLVSCRSHLIAGLPVPDLFPVVFYPKKNTEPVTPT